MIRYLLLMALCFPVCAAEAPNTPLAANESSKPVVKLSRSGNCYTVESDFYNKILKFTPYVSIEACVKAGGKITDHRKHAGWGAVDCDSPDLEALGLKYMCTDK